MSHQFRRLAEYKRLPVCLGLARRPAGAEREGRRTGREGRARRQLPPQSRLAFRAQLLLPPDPPQGLPSRSTTSRSPSTASSRSTPPPAGSASASPASTWKTTPRAPMTASATPTATPTWISTAPARRSSKSWSKPNLRSSDEAYAYLTILKQVCNIDACDMNRWPFPLQRQRLPSPARQPQAGAPLAEDRVGLALPATEKLAGVRNSRWTSSKAAR